MPSRISLPVSSIGRSRSAGVGAELPDHQIGLLIDHVLPETREHLGGVLAVDATIENNDRYVGIKPVEFGREPGRIGCIGRARAGARRRR
jgi:hypothetical protein